MSVYTISAHDGVTVSDDIKKIAYKTAIRHKQWMRLYNTSIMDQVHIHIRKCDRRGSQRKYTTQSLCKTDFNVASHCEHRLRVDSLLLSLDECVCFYKTWRLSVHSFASEAVSDHISRYISAVLLSRSVYLLVIGRLIYPFQEFD